MDGNREEEDSRVLSAWEFYYKRRSWRKNKIIIFEGLFGGSMRWLTSPCAAKCVCVTAGMLTAHHRRGLGATIVHRQSKT